MPVVLAFLFVFFIGMICNKYCTIHHDDDDNENLVECPGGQHRQLYNCERKGCNSCSYVSVT